MRGPILFLGLAGCALASAGGPDGRPRPDASAPPGPPGRAQGAQEPAAGDADRATPRGAIRAFADRLEARDYAALVAMAPPDLRRDLTPEALAAEVEAEPGATAALIVRLRHYGDAPITVRGRRAEMEYGGALFELEYDPEAGAWTVTDPD